MVLNFKSMNSHPTKASLSLVQNRKLKEKDKTVDEDEINFEDFVIIWLDDDSIDCRLKSLNTVTRSFTDPNKCIAYIKTIKREFIFLIVGRLTLAKPFLHLKHECRQLKSIYVLSLRQPELIDQRKDAKLFVDIPSLIENLEIDLRQTIKFRSLKEKEDLGFVWHYLFFKLLREIDPPLHIEKENFFEKLKHFYRNDEKQIKLIDDFQRNYSSQNALRWLRREHKFLSQTLNKAFRIKDYAFLLHYRFYLKDLCDQMMEFKSETTSKKLIVYQIQQKFRFKEMNKLSNGSLILFKTFLFTTSAYPQTNDTVIEFHIHEHTSHPFAPLNENGDLVFYPMSVFRLDFSKEKFLRLIMDEQTDLKMNQMVNNGIQTYSLEPHNPIKMGLALWKFNIGTIQQVDFIS